MADVLAFVAAHPRTYGNSLHGRADLWVVIEDLPGKTAAEKLYNHAHPGAWEAARTCKVCERGPMLFRGGKYQTYCSSKCCARDPEVVTSAVSRMQTPEARENRKRSLSKRHDRDGLDLFQLAQGKPKPYLGGKYVDPLHKVPVVVEPEVMTHDTWVDEDHAQRQRQTIKRLEEALG